MSKVVKEPITLEDVETVISMAVEVGAEIVEYEGVLNDNYIIYDTEHLQITDEETSSFIILLAEYATSWSNNLYLIRTNDVKVVEHYEKLFEN